ncbi:unnamed protein product, partial [Prorocentrum cordatum]
RSFLAMLTVLFLSLPFTGGALHGKGKQSSCPGRVSSPACPSPSRPARRRCGLPDCQFDAVVAEQRLGADAHGGLGLLRLLGELWDGVRAEGAPPAPPRPLFCLLTPSWDREVAEEVRARPKACMARYDRPGDILQKVQQGLQPAAVLPPAGLLGL